MFGHMQQKGMEGARMALSKRMGIRQVLAAVVFAATTLSASPLYLEVISEQTASDADWLAVAETLAERHGGEIVPCAGGAFSVFPEELRLELAACRSSRVYFGARPEGVAQIFTASAHWTPCPIRVAHLWQKRPCYTCLPGADEPLKWEPIVCSQ